MQIHLVIPGFIWPGATLSNPASDLALPALTRLLGTGRRQTGAFEPLDRQLARLLGVGGSADSDAPLPLAALRRRGEPAADDDASGHWLCADPVHLSFAREHLLLNDLPADELSPDETDALLAALNETFPDLGRFEACSPTRWYLKLAQPTEATLFPLHDVIGRPIRHFLPEGRDARLWQRTMNEVQVLLHNHPVNQAREQSGRRAANSLWFWGAGALPEPRAVKLPAVQANDPLVRGMARAAGTEATAPDPASLRQDTLVVIDSLLAPARQLDLDQWREQLAAVERDWFAPLADALRAGRLDRLVLTAPGDRATLELTVRSADRWKLWRRPLPYEALLRTLVEPAAPLPHSGPPER